MSKYENGNIKHNIILLYRDITGKNGREYFFIGWGSLLFIIIFLFFVYKISTIICTYKIGQIIMTILTCFVITPYIIITLYRAYKKECKEIENKENKDG